jgi:ATP-binding cassette, subfamily C (CFTR/MRP), member 1
MNETILRCSLPTLSADAKFGPLVEGCRDDFTITFEQYFLSIVPSVLFLLLAPIRANTLRKRQARVGGHVLRYTKLVCILRQNLSFNTNIHRRPLVSSLHYNSLL